MSVTYGQGALKIIIIIIIIIGIIIIIIIIIITNSVALVRERTIATERPPLVGEISANFWE
jgi:hypothetical protein